MIPVITTSTGLFKPGIRAFLLLETMESRTCYTTDGHPFSVTEYRLAFTRKDGSLRTDRPDRRPCCQLGRDFSLTDH